MGDLLKRIKTNSLVTAALYALLGLVLLVWPGLSASVFCGVLGAVLLVCGLVDIALFLTNRDGSLYAGAHLVVGIILAVVGVYVMTQPALVSVVIPRIVGILICIHGASNLRDTFRLRGGGDLRWNAALVLALLTVLLGAVLICNPFAAFATVVRAIGVFLLYDGLSDLWIVSRVSRVDRQAKSAAQAKADAVDVDYTEEP